MERPNTWTTVTCTHCGTDFRRLASDVRRRAAAGMRGPYCGMRCANVGRPRKAVASYRWINMGDGTTETEHRLIMMTHLGRPLSPEEEVHHKDRNRSNNEIENLAVLTHKEHGAEHRGPRKTVDMDEVARRWRERQSVSKIARDLGVDRSTVYVALSKLNLHEAKFLERTRIQWKKRAAFDAARKRHRE